MSKAIEVYVDEDNKIIFRDLNKYLNELKNSAIEQDKTIDDKGVLIYRLKVSHRNTEWRFHLKSYEEVRNEIIRILKDGLYLFIDEKIYNFDNFSIELLKVKDGERK